MKAGLEFPKMKKIKCLVSAGATREYFDPVRFVSNPSTGKMGLAIAKAAADMGWQTTLLLAPSQLKKPDGVEVIDVVSADDMLREARKRFDDCDILIMTAAVCDMRPKFRCDKKVKKEALNMNVEFEQTPDILKTLSREKFAGAEETYTIEPMMHNGVALQGGTSHYFGTGFTRAFDITFTGRDNQIYYPHQTSWGLSTRSIGAIIMTHGDDSGLILPPRVAPIQVVIIPAAQHKEGVLEAAGALRDRLTSAGIRVKLDDSENSAGWKFSQYEMKGVPVRLEIGPRDIAANSCVLVSRVTREKKFVSLDNITDEVNAMLNQVHDELLARAQKNLEEKTFVAHSYEEFLDIAANHPGYIKAMWCGETACEDKLKDVTGGVKSRCIPFHEDTVSDVCVCCGKPAKHMVVWGRQY